MRTQCWSVHASGSSAHASFAHEVPVQGSARLHWLQRELAAMERQSSSTRLTPWDSTWENVSKGLANAPAAFWSEFGVCICWMSAYETLPNMSGWYMV